MVWFLVYLVYFLSPDPIRIGGCKAISLASVRLSFFPSVDESVLNTLRDIFMINSTKKLWKSQKTIEQKNIKTSN